MDLRIIQRGVLCIMAAVLVGCSGELMDERESTGGATFGGSGATFPQDPAAGGASGANPPGTAGMPGDPRITQRVWRLTGDQLNDEVRRLFGDQAPLFDVPESASEAGITNVAANGVVDLGNASFFNDSARAIGAWVAQQGGTALRCPSYGDDACIDGFLAWAVRGAFRRPVEAAEVGEFRTLFNDLRASYDYDYAVSGLVRALLLSPDFLYRTEIGDGGVMTQYEIAVALAYALTDRSPDVDLFSAADAGLLTDPNQREAQVRRLMAASDRTLQRFFWEWLSMETLYSQAAEVGLDPTLVAQMEEEFRAFVNDVLVGQRGTLRQLLSASHTWVQPALAAHYGVAHPGGGLARVELDPAQRGGLLTQGAWLVSHGKKGADNVVRRGMNLFKQTMCNNNLAPPEGLDVNAALLDLVGPNATVRETVDARGSAPSCGGCHKLADPMGIAFESYGSDGRFQTTYASGLPVDSFASIEGLGDFQTAPALTAALVDDPAFQSCFVRRVTHYVAGIDMGTPAQAAWVDQALQTFIQSDTSIEELLVALIRHPAFIERPTETP